MLTENLLSFTLMGPEWILWLLIVLSMISVAIIFERTLFFLNHRMPGADAVVVHLLKNEIDAVNARIDGRRGLQAAVVRTGISLENTHPEVAEELIAATVSRERKRYERGMGFLGTVGSNAPFIGLFGTVLGIIKAFHELGQAAGKGAQAAAGGAPQVMSGISEALVATAVGLLVAIPAVVAFNTFSRWSGGIAASANELGHAAMARLHREVCGGAAQSEPRGSHGGR